MDYQYIYQHRADDYDRLVSAEDCDGHLLPAIESIAPLAGATVVEVGAGTGRVTRLVAPRAARVIAFEKSKPMLEVAQKRVRAGNVVFGCADAAELPLDAASASVALAGWVFGHQRSWNADTWRTTIGRCLRELERVLVSGGTIVIVETLGTGSEHPAPPRPELAEYYAWLENDEDFRRLEIATDYQFASVDEAAEVTGFFFGDDFAERVRQNRWSRVPEWTGLWWRQTSRTRSPGAGT